MPLGGLIGGPILKGSRIQVRAEQANLDDFEGRLDALEREIFDELKKQETESKKGEQKKEL
jgi:hypothetical protein